MALLTEGSEPGVDVLTGVIADSKGHMSFQSGETLEHAAYGGSGPHSIIMISSDKQEIRGEGGRVVEETNYAGQAVDLALWVSQRKW